MKDDYIRIPIREEEHKQLLMLQDELTGKISSYRVRPSFSDVIKALALHYKETGGSAALRLDEAERVSA